MTEFTLVAATFALVFAVSLGVLYRRLAHALRDRDAAKIEAAQYDEKFKSFATYRARVSRLVTELQQAVTIESLVQTFMSTATPLIGAKYGAFYIANEEHTHLSPLGGYATMSAELRQSFAFGEGLVGQCAHDGQAVTVFDMPDTNIQVVSGMGHDAPKQILMQAVMQKNRVIGVLEFAAVNTFNDTARPFLEELMPTLAMSIEILDRNLRSQALLIAKREQAELLEQQQTALQDSFNKRDEANKALQRQVSELAAARLAMLNIMEDLEESRVLAEATRKPTPLTLDNPP